MRAAGTSLVARWACDLVRLPLDCKSYTASVSADETTPQARAAGRCTTPTRAALRACRCQAARQQAASSQRAAFQELPGWDVGRYGAGGPWRHARRGARRAVGRPREIERARPPPTPAVRAQQYAAAAVRAAVAVAVAAAGLLCRRRMPADRASAAAGQPPARFSLASQLGRARSPGVQWSGAPEMQVPAPRAHRGQEHAAIGLPAGATGCGLTAAGFRSTTSRSPAGFPRRAQAQTGTGSGTAIVRPLLSASRPPTIRPSQALFPC